MTIQIDEMMDVRARKEGGRVVSASRLFKLSGIAPSTQLGAINEILSDPQIPASGSAISIENSILLLMTHDVEMKEDRTLAELTLGYEGGQSTSNTTGEVRRGGDVALSQFTSKTDREGNEITVQHEGISKRVGVNVYSPQAAPWIETFESTNDPDGLASQWIGVVNSSTWRGRAEGVWIVARVRWEEVNPDANPQVWRFRWQFQESPKSQGWLPVVAFIDQETNEMPLGLVVGQGIRDVPWYYKRDFNFKFD